MWGYFCGGAVATNPLPAASCAALNPAPAATWSPVVITVPSGQALTINLTNNLSFPAGTGANNIPTSIMIVGQIGGGLGSHPAGCVGDPTCSPAPDHSRRQANNTWFIANTGSSGVPPVQGNRVRSFGTEVPATQTTALTWGGATQPPLRPGTYLLESGTHPSIQVPMGLYGILVVTTAPTTSAAGTAIPPFGTTGHPGYVPPVTYNAEVPLAFSEIDPVQNKEVDTAVRTAGFSENATRDVLWRRSHGR